MDIDNNSLLPVLCAFVAIMMFWAIYGLFNQPQPINFGNCKVCEQPVTESHMRCGGVFHYECFNKRGNKKINTNQKGVQK